jgi:hypothetical protein
MMVSVWQAVLWLNLVARKINEIILISRNTDSHKFGTKISRSAESAWTGELVLEISCHNTFFGC